MPHVNPKTDLGHHLLVVADRAEELAEMALAEELRRMAARLAPGDVLDSSRELTRQQILDGFEALARADKGDLDDRLVRAMVMFETHGLINREMLARIVKDRSR